MEDTRVLRQNVIFIFVTLIAVLLASCTQESAQVQEELANGESPQPTSTPGPPPADSPTAKPTPTQQSTPTPEPTPVETPEPLSDADAAQIYAAAIHQMHSVDHSFGGDPPEFPLVYIVSTTDDGTLLYAPATPPQELEPELRQAIEAELSDQPFEIIWVDSLDDAPLDQSNGKIAEGKGIVITMGNILAQDDGTVQLPFYMLCGTLCLSGKTYVLEGVDGAWQVTGSVGAEIQG